MQFKLTLTCYRDGETHYVTYPSQAALSVAESVIETMFPGRYRMDVATVITAGSYIMPKSLIDTIREAKRLGMNAITLIKMIREVSGAGLKEAKDAYDAI